MICLPGTVLLAVLFFKKCKANLGLKGSPNLSHFRLIFITFCPAPAPALLLLSNWLTDELNSRSKWRSRPILVFTPCPHSHLNFKKVLTLKSYRGAINFFLKLFLNSLKVGDQKTELTPVYINKGLKWSSWVRKSKQKVKTMLFVDLKLQFFRYGTT